VPPALASLPPPFVAAAPGLWRERFAACCPRCFAASATCLHHAEAPLRLLIVGHNPSETAWRTGYPYANGTNRFWRLMQLGGLVPPEFAASDADVAPALLGLGITDVGCAPGSDAAAFKRPQMRAWRAELCARLTAHCARAAAWAVAAARARVSQRL
jgi:TDG/mug DNA glycosylase family protein